MERAKRCLALFYEPDRRAEDKVGVLEAFGRALRFKPLWAVMQAFDRWEATETRRPTPGNIVGLSDQALLPFTRELAERQKLAAAAEAEPERISKEAAAEIMARAGFDAKRTEATKRHRMARSESELYAAEDARKMPHWSETAAPEDPKWDQLRRVRDENPIVQAARRDAEKRAQMERGAA